MEFTWGERFLGFGVLSNILKEPYSLRQNASVQLNSSCNVLFNCEKKSVNLHWFQVKNSSSFSQTHNERSCQCVCQCSCQNQCHCFVLKTFFLGSVHFIQTETTSVYIFILVKKKFANVFLLLRWRKLLSVCYVWGNF